MGLINRNGHRVLWGSAYKLDVQVGSKRDRMLYKHERADAYADAVLRDLMVRSQQAHDRRNA